MGDEEGKYPAEGDEQVNAPPFVVFKKRLYVLAKKAPGLDHRAGGGEESEPRPVQMVVPRRRPVQGRAARRPAGAGRLRPYVKGTVRHSPKYPYLHPVGSRPRPKKRARKV